MKFIDFSTKPEPLLNVIVKIKSNNPLNNDNFMVAHYVPKYMCQCSASNDWSEYSDELDDFFIPEGWYANTTYIGDEWSSYYIDCEVISWAYIMEND